MRLLSDLVGESASPLFSCSVGWRAPGTGTIPLPSLHPLSLSLFGRLLLLQLFFFLPYPQSANFAPFPLFPIWVAANSGQ